MDKEIVSVQVVFAEDIREEKNGQYSLIGVFQDNIDTPNLPLQFPKFAMLVLISTRIDAPAIIKGFRLFAQDNDENEVTFISQSFDDQMLEAQKKSLDEHHTGQQWKSLNMKVAAHGLNIEKESQLFMEVTSMNDIKYKSNSLAIQKRDSETTASINFGQNT